MIEDPIGLYSNSLGKFMFAGLTNRSEKRRALIIKMNDLLIADGAVLPLVERSLVLGISPSLDGVDPTPWDSDVWNIKDWRRK